MANNVAVKAIITAEDRASAVLQGFGGSLKNMGNQAVSSLKATAVAFGVATSAASAFAIKGAADFEQTRIGIENMLGSADKAKILLSDISKFAAQTPFEFPELAQATRQLIAFGFSADDAFNTMKQLGDVSAAVGAPMNDLAYLMGTLRTQGRAFTVDIRQFAQRGIPIYEYLAKVLHTNEKAISAMIEEGKIGFPEVQKAFTMMTAAGGKFHGTMEKQSKSLSGLWSTLKDNIGATGREIIGISTSGDVRENSIFDILRRSAGGLVEFLSANQPQIIRFIQGIIDKIVNLTKAIGPTVVQFFKEFAETIRDWVLPFLITAKDKIVELHSKFPLLTEIVGVVAALGVALMVNPLVAFTTLAIVGLTLLHQHWDFITELIKQKVADFNKWLDANPMAKSVLETIKFLIGNIVESVRDMLIPEIKRFWKLFGPDIMNIVKLFGAVLVAAFTGALVIVNVLIQAVSKVLKFFNDVRQVVKDVYNGVGDIFAKIPGIAKVGLPARAGGGPVTAGQPYIVGEKRAEVFVPNSNGTILPEVPNGGGSVTANVTISGVFMGTPAEARKLAQMVADNLKDIAGAKNQTVGQFMGGV